MENTTSETVKRRALPTILVSVLCVLLVGLSYLWHLTTAIQHTEPITVDIKPGTSVLTIAAQLESHDLIRSTQLFRVLYYLFHKDEPMQAGRYSFTEQYSMVEILRILTQGESDFVYTEITFPEGITVQQMAELAEVQLTDFKIDEYTELATPYEGRVFPDTYYVDNDTDAAILFAIQRAAYQEMVTTYAEKISQHTLTELEIITLASIIEREAKDVESMRTVSGILQNRLAIDMPLQADASIGYITEGTEITAADLQIDSPYNTYLYRGLPPTPIGNPGQQAIDAVLDPIESEYYYYITGNDGVFYYAKTLNEHNENIATYLR